MHKLKFERCEFDACLYLRKEKNGNMMYLLLYIDDMLLASKNMSDIQHFKELFKSKFDMKGLGSSKKIFGMELRRDRRKSKMFISQMKYIEKTLKKFGMDECKIVSTPLVAHFKLSLQQRPKTEKNKLEMSPVPYLNVVGSLMYAMIGTRPDITHSVSVVSIFMAFSGKQHWDGVKWIFRY